MKDCRVCLFSCDWEPMPKESADATQRLCGVRIVARGVCVAQGGAFRGNPTRVTNNTANLPSRVDADAGQYDKGCPDFTPCNEFQSTENVEPIS